MPEPVKVNVVSYGGVKPGQAVAVTSFNGEKHIIFDSSTREDGDYAFYRSGITEFSVPMPMLKRGQYMFNSCRSLVSFTGAMPLLEDATRMFELSPLKTWQCALPKLKNANYMFNGNPVTFLEEWTTDLPEVTQAIGMFSNQNYSTFLRFAADVHNLSDARQMFMNCYNFCEFYGGEEGLKSLTNGNRMFQLCSLTPASVKHVLNTIPDRASAGLSVELLGIGRRINFKTDPDVKSLLGETGAEITAKTYRVKGWDIVVEN